MTRTPKGASSTRRGWSWFGPTSTWRTFFRVSEILLLLLAGALLVSGIEKSIGLGILPPVVNQLWDSTLVLDDSSRVGGVVASLTGYSARTALLPLIALLVYWVIVSLSLRRRA